MATKIEWAEESWNPITGCTKVSEGCKYCYAERMSKRLVGRFGYPADDPFRMTLHPERLGQPGSWRKRRRIFVCSMSDLFHEDVPDNFIWVVLRTVLTGNRRHTYVILTKRPERMYHWFEEYAPKFWHYHAPDEPQRPCVAAPWPDPQLWLGISAENQQRADERVPWLLRTPAAVRFVSAEPLLGPINLGLVGTVSKDISGTAYRPASSYIHWIIVGGESGLGARPMMIDWAQDIVMQCQDAGVPVFVKQLGTWAAKFSKLKSPKGQDPQEWPQELRVRQFPQGD